MVLCSFKKSVFSAVIYSLMTLFHCKLVDPWLYHFFSKITGFPVKFVSMDVSPNMVFDIGLQILLSINSIFKYL